MHAEGVARAVDLPKTVSAERGLGVIWTQDGSSNLNANLVRFEAGEGVEIHANNDMDKTFVGVSGSGTVVVDGVSSVLRLGRVVFVPRGCLRAIRSSSGDFAYLTVHRRRVTERAAPNPHGGTWQR
jgi:quercetin dioxygenase-like cupin family protein